MKRSTVLILVLVILFSQFTYAVNFVFVDSQEKWEEVTERSKREDKLIFLEFYGESCEPCMEMDKNTFTDLSLSVFLNKAFVSVRIDVSADFGMEMLAEFEATNIPVFFILDPAGHDMSGKLIGYRSPDKIIELGKHYKELYRELTELRNKFYSGNKDEYLVLRFANLLYQLNYEEEAQLISGIYFTNITAFNYVPDEWLMIRNAIRDIDDKNLTRFLKEISSFKNIYGKQKVDEYLQNVFLYNFAIAVGNKDTVMIHRALVLIDELSYPDSVFGLPAIRLKDYFFITYFEQNEMWKEYAERVVRHVNRFKVSEEEYREFIVRFYLNIDEQNMNKQADFWARKLVKNNKSFPNVIVYALTQSKLGKTSKALKLLDKAGKIAADDEQRKLVVDLSRQFSEIQEK
jgi:thioredoxin-related protein